MPVPPASGTFTIVSLSGSVLIGVSTETETTSTAPVVASVDTTTWNITQQDGYNVFQFAIADYPYVGVYNSSDVTATTDVTQNLNWFARYIESQDAYTIEMNDTLGNAWTVSSTSVANPPVEITPIPTSSSNTFNPSTSQLFTFNKVS